MTAGESLSDLFGRAEFLADSIDFAGQRLKFVRAERSRVEQLPFIDGRESLGEPGPSVPLADALGAEWQRPPGPDRFIFHVGFCGSTFLATVLQRAGAFVLREPHVLIDVSDAHEMSPGDQAVASLAHLAADLLRRPWREREPVVCKPSNWCNDLAPLLIEEQRETLAVFLTATPHEYLVAILRGGTSRIENVARTAHHLLNSRPDGAELWNEIMRSTADPLDRGARLALVALQAHLRLFEAAGAQGGNTSFSLAELDATPLEVVGKVASQLQLELAEKAFAAAIGLVGGGHSKQPGESFSIRQREDLDRAVEAHHGEAIRGALAWAEKALKP